MHRWERAIREDRYKLESKNPSFSSTLLDEIYRSTCEADTNHEDLKFYGETMMPMKHTRGSSVKVSRAVEENKEMEALRRACLIEKWMDSKVTQKVSTQHSRKKLTEFERKLQLEHDLDQDAVFFSSTSISSDSSFGGFSSSDTESCYGARSMASSSFFPTRPKPVRTSVSTRSGKTEKTERKVSTLFHEQTPRVEENIIKSKSRALKIYDNLKKVKQPTSPGGKLANFIHSLFTNGNTKKARGSSSVSNCDEAWKSKPRQAPSTCSSVSSFSRSCLSKSSPSTREKLRNGVKRSVRFYPVSVIVDEDCRPCGHKSLYKEEQSSSFMSVSFPKSWKIGKSPTRKVDDELKYQVIEKTRKVGEVAREFLKDYRQNQKKNDDLIMRNDFCHYNDQFGDDDDEDEDDEDDSSCSSSDLFELDHLSVIGKNKYCEELPVYETTRVNTNRAIANSLIM
ncbi:protein BIG GRAIN 1-like B [Manihot esculenta]|uniref:Protein BIG GRAIN 1-like A n=1 Tax=Manihot esculenta TaxID=3983 RepID=A0A2C9W4S2_MANES|nr:protein BIG GRAIN 1-like B [Manihot esculenta]OAY54148.1 hypothetical protein MANES_03G052400v8 [Manihot esculenta]